MQDCSLANRLLLSRSFDDSRWTKPMESSLKESTGTFNTVLLIMERNSIFILSVRTAVTYEEIIKKSNNPQNSTETSFGLIKKS